MVAIVELNPRHCPLLRLLSHLLGFVHLSKCARMGSERTGGNLMKRTR